MSEPKRLDKRLIELIHCTRAEAQKYIKDGWVRVDGEVEVRPNLKVQAQKVVLHDDATLEVVPPVTLLLNLPEGFDPDAPTAPLQLMNPETHAEDDDSGIIMLDEHFSQLTPTTPLEAGATGLLVFTKDWRVTRRLVEDARKNEQEYIVELSDEIDNDVVKQLNRPIKMGNWPLPKTKVSMQSEKRLRFALESVRPGQIEHMCQSVGLTIVTMRRIRIGRISMGKLPPGRWRYLPGALQF